MRGGATRAAAVSTAAKAASKPAGAVDADTPPPAAVAAAVNVAPTAAVAFTINHIAAVFLLLGSALFTLVVTYSSVYMAAPILIWLKARSSSTTRRGSLACHADI